jgi:hypothetical protein
MASSEWKLFHYVQSLLVLRLHITFVIADLAIALRYGFDNCYALDGDTPLWPHRDETLPKYTKKPVI